MARYTSKNTTVEILDSTGVYAMLLGPGEGDLSIDNIQEDNSEGLPVYDRGVFDGMVEGDDQQQAISISIKLRNEALTSAVADRPLDAIRKTGLWSAATTCAPSGSTKWMHRLKVTMNDGVTSTTWEMLGMRSIGSFAEGKDGHTLSISGTNYKGYTVT